MQHRSGFFRRHVRTIGALLFVFLFSFSVSLATPPATKYEPGATLDPSCAPGSTNCSVQILPAQSGNTNRLLTTDGSTTSWTNTLSGVNISGSANTLSNIPNGALVNSSITVNGTPVALGGSVSNLALTISPLSQFAATTSSELANVISDETGSGTLVFATSPALTTPNIGIASGESLTLTSGSVGIRVQNTGGANTTYDAFVGSDNTYTYFTNYANTRGLFIKQNGDIALQGGNVGIGTTSPGAKLDVAGAITAAGLISMNATAATNTPFMWATGSTTGSIYGTVINSGGRMTWGVDSSAGGALATGTSAYASVIGSTAGFSTPLQLITNGIVRQSIDSSGVITISNLAGSGNRCAYVDSNGALRAKNFDCGSASGGDNLGDHTATQNILLNGNWLSNDGGSEGIRIDNSGNVGVGTASPGATLDVQATTASLRVLSTTGTNYAYQIFANTSGSMYLGTENSSGGGIFTGSAAYASVIGSMGAQSFQIATNGTVRQTVDSNGNVGIGTSSPGALLHLLSSSVNGTHFRLQNSDTGGKAWEIISTGSSNGAGAGKLFFYDGSSNPMTLSGANVGIGTTSPDTALTVSTSTGADSVKIVSSSHSRISLQSTATDGDTWSIYSALDGSYQVFDQDTSTYAIYSQPSTSTGIFMTGAGSVGIGTTNPLAPIHVGNNTATSTDAQILVSRLVTGTSGNGHAFVDASGISRSGTIGYNSYDANVQFSGTANYDHYAGFQSRPDYESSGTVGKIYGVLTQATVGAGTATNIYGNYVVETSGAGTVANQYGLYVEGLSKATTNNYAIYTAGTTQSYFGGYVHFGQGIYIPDGFSLLWGTSGATDYISGNSGNHTVTIATNGADSLTVNNGNVGIGTSNPQRQLDVSNTAGDSSMTVTASNTGQSSYWFGRANDTNNGGIYYTHSNNQMGFRTGDAERMVIDASGNVGIGTMSPGTKLDIAGALTLQVGTNNTGGIFIPGAGTVKTHIGTGFDATFIQNNNYYNGSSYVYDDNTKPSSVVTLSGGGFSVQTGAANTAPTAKLSVDVSGNVGIGTSSPSEKLTIGGIGSAMKFAPGDTSGQGNNAIISRIIAQSNYGVADSTSAAEIRFLTGTDAWYKGQIAFYTNSIDSTAGSSAERMRIDQNGNVGIGTTSPANMLQVGSIGSTGFGGNQAVFGNGTNALAIGVDNTSPVIYSNVGMRFYTGGSERMRIDSNGNVGIGTTSPWSKLNVSSQGKDGLTIDDTTPFAAGVGASILLRGNYRSAGDMLSAARIAAEKTNGTDGNYSYNLAFYTTNHAGASPSATPALKLMNDNSASFASGVSVNGTVSATQFNANYGAVFQLYNDAQNHYWYMRTLTSFSNNFRFSYDGSDRAEINNSTGAYTALSDRNKKKNFEDYTGGLAEILALKPTLYNMIDQDDGTPKELGFIAQDVKDIVPQAYTQTGDFIGLNYSAFTPVIVNAIKEMDINVMSIADLDRENSWRDSLIAWFGNATNKITRIFTGEICLSESEEETECIDRAQLHQLKQLLAMPPQSSGDSGGSSNDTGTPEEESDTPPSDEGSQNEEQPTDEPHSENQPPAEDLQQPPSEEESGTPADNTEQPTGSDNNPETP